MDFPPTLLHALENFPLLAQDGCSRPIFGFVRLSNQYVTSIEIREKMVDWGEKKKTHVSKISPGSQARNYP
jgi:hypothetical protein